MQKVLTRTRNLFMANSNSDARVFHINAKIEPIVRHVLRCLERHRAGAKSVSAAGAGVGAVEVPVPPLFVAFQGPQGSGKTFLTSHLRKVLSSQPHNLSIAVLSIDDLYLPHSRLKHVAQAHLDNPLLSGRGQPGTHDVELGMRILSELKAINNDVKNAALEKDAEGGGGDTGTGTGTVGVRLPVFDKSLHSGEGDRLPDTAGPLIHPPLDVVLFEGWCVGFGPSSPEEIRRCFFEERIEDLEGVLDLRKRFEVKDVLEISENLSGYVRLWEFLDVFVQVKPPDATPYSLIYKWRLQQEHNMKTSNGGKGMTDDQVKTFVDRYIPGYIFFSDGIEHGYYLDLDSNSGNGNGTSRTSGTRRPPRWIGNGLKISIDETRNLVSVDEF